MARLVGGPAFAPAGLLVGLMALAQLLRIASVVLESGVMALGRAGYALVAQAGAASLTEAQRRAAVERFGATMRIAGYLERDAGEAQAAG